MTLTRTVRRLLMTLAILTSAVISLDTDAATGLERLVMPGEVSQAHAKTEAECAKCHIAFDKDAQPRACLECHQPIDADIKEQRGFHGTPSESQCRVCHTEHQGRAAAIQIGRTGCRARGCQTGKEQGE